jgi:prevent-host-death family protein
MAHRTISASEFKARCLALLDEVAEKGQPLVVTKRGKPVARVLPVEEAWRLLGTVAFSSTTTSWYTSACARTSPAVDRSRRARLGSVALA